MHHLRMSEHGLRIAAAALVSLAIAPAAAADDSSSVLTGPAALAEVLVEQTVGDPAALDPGALVATVTEALPGELPTLPAAEAVPAAAAEPMPALEPQPTPLGTPPPPAQPSVGSKVVQAAPDPSASAPKELEPLPKPQPAAVDEQYQPEPPQYQPVEPAAPPPEAAMPPTEQEFGWSWNPGTGSEPSAAAPLESISSWNADGFFTAPLFYSVNNLPQNSVQYHTDAARYHSLNVSVSIRLGEAADESPVMKANVVVAVGGDPVIATAHGPPPVQAQPVAPENAPVPDPSADPPRGGQDDARVVAPRAASAPRAIPSSSWTPRSAMPREVQQLPDGHRSRSPHRQPTRRPLPPLRGPVIPVSSSGAAPLGGADGGGSHLTLLLAPFALALVDSARRVVRDAAPPVVRERDERRERPG